MALMRRRSRLMVPAPPPSPIPTGTGSRSAGNETFKAYLDQSIQPPRLSLPESRFLSGANPVPAVIDYRSVTSPAGGEPVARMLKSVNDFGAFRIISHGISSEEIISVVNEAKCLFEDSSEKNKEGVRSPVSVNQNGNREAIVQFRYRKDSRTSANPVVQAETHRPISQKMKKIASKLEDIAEKLSEILSESMEEQWVEKVKKGEKETIFTIYRYNHQNLFEENVPNKKEKKERESDEREVDERVIMSLHIPGEPCQFHVNPHQHCPLCFDVGTDTIVVTIDNQLWEWSSGSLRNARSEMVFVPDLLGGRTSFSIELKFSHPNKLHHPQSNLISISDQVLYALLLASFYFLYTYISSLFNTT